MPSVSLDRVTLRFGDRAVLDQASTRIDGPAVVAVVGPSGAGKTTLLHVMAGLLRPTLGSVAIADGGSRPAWVVQNSPLLTRRTARENVAAGAIAGGAGWHDAQDAAMPILAGLGIMGLAEHEVYRLSGGERQRIAVARAIAAGSPLIFADEPTASLDEQSRDLVFGALAEAATRGALVVLTTHDPEVAARADRILALRQGSLIDETYEPVVAPHSGRGGRQE